MIRYHLTFVALLLLTSLTFALSFLDLGSLSIPIALMIATTKTVLIALFFMHLIDQRASNWIAFVVSILLLVTLIGLSLLDVASRTRAPLRPPLAALAAPPSRIVANAAAGASRIDPPRA